MNSEYWLALLQKIHFDLPSFTFYTYSLNSQCDEWVENRVFSPFIFYSYLPSST